MTSRYPDRFPPALTFELWEGKDWVDCLTNNATFHRYWGKVGLVNQHQQIKGNHMALRKLVQQKLATEYRVVDEYHANQEWISEQRSRRPDTRQTQATATLSWQTLKPITASDPIQIKASGRYSLAWDF